MHFKSKFFQIIKFILSLFLLYHFHCYSTSVSFIIPGKSDEDFWLTSAKFAQSVAKNLKIDLELLYAERDRIYMVKLAEDITKRVKKPDYVFIVNEKLSAENMLEVLNKNKIKTFLVYVDLTNEQKKVLGYPRQKLKYWLGTITPDNVNAGYLIAKEIFKSAKDKISQKTNLKMIAINGDNATPASTEREKGLEEFIKENKKITLNQIVTAEWNKEIAYEKAKVLLARYKDINLIWAANDPMAIGALKAAKENGNILGKNIFIAGLNWSKEAIEEVKQGNLASTIGGHFMIGGCSLIVLYDYINGKDYSINKHELNVKIFSSLNSSEAGSFLSYLNEKHWDKINFKKFSKVFNPKIKNYDFNAKNILLSGK